MDNEDGRGSIKDFSKMKLSAALVRLVYPSVLSDFINQLSEEETKKRVFRIGYNSGKEFFQYFKIKGKKMSVIIKKIYSKVWDSKVKIRKEEENKWLLESKNCPICGDLPPLELENVHYCEPIAGFIQGYINELIEIRDIGIGTRKIKVQTIQSRCSQDTKNCIQELIILGGT